MHRAHNRAEQIATMSKNPTCLDLTPEQERMAFMIIAVGFRTAYVARLTIIRSSRPAVLLHRRFLERPGIEAVILDHVPASLAYQFHRLERRDPADRLLIATAIELVCPLVTYDERIARFSQKHGRQYRFAVAA